MKKAREFGVLRTATGGEVPIRNRQVSQALRLLQDENRGLRKALMDTTKSADAMAARLNALARSRWVRIGRALRVLPH